MYDAQEQIDAVVEEKILEALCGAESSEMVKVVRCPHTMITSGHIVFCSLCCGHPWHFVCCGACHSPLHACVATPPWHMTGQQVVCVTWSHPTDYLCSTGYESFTTHPALRFFFMLVSPVVVQPNWPLFALLFSPSLAL